MDEKPVVNNTEAQPQSRTAKQAESGKKKKKKKSAGKIVALVIIWAVVICVVIFLTLFFASKIGEFESIPAMLDYIKGQF